MLLATGPHTSVVDSEVVHKLEKYSISEELVRDCVIVGELGLRDAWRLVAYGGRRTIQKYCGKSIAFARVIRTDRMLMHIRRFVRPTPNYLCGFDTSDSEAV